MASLRPRDTTTFIDPETGQVFTTNNLWYTRTGQIIRFSIFFGLFFLLVAYIAIGYYHAKIRIKKGLKPLAYHRWLLNRSQRAQYDPSYQNPSVYYQPHNPNQNQNYSMQPMPPMPPPMYDPNAQMPPTYQPPAGATKVDPSQWRAEPTRRPAEGSDEAPEYEAPAGPPPAALRAEDTGGANTV